MSNIIVGKGKLGGKGVYANCNFRAGEKVLDWNLRKLSQEDYNKLTHEERKYVHSFWAEMYLFDIPSRFTNHSSKPNTRADFKLACDFALRDIEKGEMITTNATEEILFEVTTFVEVYENHQPINNFNKLNGGYRNVTVSYTVKGERKLLQLRRENGNWRIIID